MIWIHEKNDRQITEEDKKMDSNRMEEMGKIQTSLETNNEIMRIENSKLGGHR